MIIDLNEYRRSRRVQQISVDSVDVDSVDREIKPRSYISTVQFVADIKERLESSFGPYLPRGGVIFKSPVLKAINAIDTYGRGNLHNSTHQYRGAKQWWNKPFPFPSDLVKIERYLATMSGKTVHLGYKSDPFQWVDCKYGVTKRVLQLASQYNVKLVIWTMSDLVGHDDYLDLIAPVTERVMMHLGVGEQQSRLERRLSPGAPSPKRRTRAVERLKQRGVKVEAYEVSHDDKIRLTNID